MNRYVENYEKKIQKLLNLFNEKDPNWIQKREWIHGMLDFELGDNFFSSFFFYKGVTELKEDFESDEIVAFQQSVITPWLDSFRSGNDGLDDEEMEKETMKILLNLYILGTEIHPDYKSAPEEEIIFQQKCLDYAWWKAIKSILYPTMKEQVQKKLYQKEDELSEYFSG